MKVLVTGATGFVGQEIVKALAAEGHVPRVLARSKPCVGSGLPASAEIYTGDILAPPTLEGATQGVEAVIHLVGIISEAGRSTFENVHVAGTRNLADAASKSGVRRFVHMSALGTRAGAASRYHQTKWQAEEYVRASGLQWTIFRPSLIYGPADHFINMFERMSRWSPALPVLGGRALFQPIAVEQVARAFVGALRRPETIGKTFELGGPERLTMREILQTILDVTGRTRVLAPIPMAVGQAQAVALELLLGKIMRRPPPLSRDQLIMLREGNVGDTRAADEVFGLQHQPLRDGLRRWLGNPTGVSPS